MSEARVHRGAGAVGLLDAAVGADDIEKARALYCEIAIADPAAEERCVEIVSRQWKSEVRNVKQAFEAARKAEALFISTAPPLSVESARIEVVPEAADGVAPLWRGRRLGEAKQAENGAPKAEAEPEAAEEAAEPAEAEPVEDDTNAANNIHRRLWRLGEALKHIKAIDIPIEPLTDKVGSAICWLCGPDKAAGRACLVECFGEEAGGKLWAAGFPEIPGSLNDIYTVAQLAGWRYPITVNLNQLDLMVEQTEAALMRARAEIYQAGNELVRPVRVEVQATKGRKAVVAVLVKIDQAFLKTELSKLVDFVTWKGEVRKGAAVPNDVVNGLLGNYGRWRFPVVSGIVTTPTMRRDGSVLMQEGWDQATGLIVMGPLPLMPALLKKPTRDDALRAARIIDEDLLTEFPFIDEASRSAAISGLITPVVRGVMSAAPLHASSAPAPGTGKSFLWDISAGISVGDAMPIISVGPNIEEMEKRLNTEILKGLTIFSIDNVSIPIGGDALCQAIERPTYRTRILSQSKGKDRLNTWTMFASGTNLRVKDDVTRRTLLVRMDAKEENPENRVFKGNPFRKVLDNRGRYIWAALTVVLAYRAAGSPGKLPNLRRPV